MDLYQRSEPDNFLVVATPGAGKTTFGLALAEQLLTRGTVTQVLLVAPTRHLKVQWAAAAARFGITLDPTYDTGEDITTGRYQGAVVTYAQIATAPASFAAAVADATTLVIMDEVHHAGDGKSWGWALRQACEPAVRRLLLTGTPFRSDDITVPFVTYEQAANGEFRSRPDYIYGYGEALRDLVVRPVTFPVYAGEATWQEGETERRVTLGEGLVDERETSRAWRTVLDPKGRWMPQVLAAANSQLARLREVVPDAGGLVIAGNHRTARAYAAILTTLTGQEPTLVLSSDPHASHKIAEFAGDPDRRWLVAVRMVSEGVDVPRLLVGVYATTYSTPLFFAQAVGRFVRSRRAGEVACVFLPSVPVLLRLAAQIEAMRDHIVPDLAIDEPPIPDPTTHTPDATPAQAALALFLALDSFAEFDRVLGLHGQWRGSAWHAVNTAIADAVHRQRAPDQPAASAA